MLLVIKGESASTQHPGTSAPSQHLGTFSAPQHLFSTLGAEVLIHIVQSSKVRGQRLRCWPLAFGLMYEHLSTSAPFQHLFSTSAPSITIWHLEPALTPLHLLEKNILEAIINYMNGSWWLNFILGFMNIFFGDIFSVFVLPQNFHQHFPLL